VSIAANGLIRIRPSARSRSFVHGVHANGNATGRHAWHFIGRILIATASVVKRSVGGRGGIRIIGAGIVRRMGLGAAVP